MPFYYIKSLGSLDSYCFAIGRACEIGKTVSLIEEGRVVNNFSLYEKAFKNLSDAIAIAKAQGRIDPQLRKMHKKLEGMVEGLNKRVDKASAVIKKDIALRKKAVPSQWGMGRAACVGMVLGMAIFGLLFLKQERREGSGLALEELLPETKEILRSGKGCQVPPCHGQRDRSLVPAPKGRDSLKLPVQEGVLQGLTCRVPNLQRIMALTAFPEHQSVEISFIGDARQIDQDARAADLEALPLALIPNSSGHSHTSVGGILQSIIDLDPTASVFSVALSVALPVISRLFLNSRAARLSAERAAKAFEARVLDRERLALFRSNRMKAAREVLEGLKQNLHPFLFEVIDSIEKDGLLLPDAAGAAAERAYNPGPMRSLLKIELMNSFAEANYMAINSQDHTALLGQVEALELSAQALSNEAGRVQELASNLPATILPALVGIMVPHLVRALLTVSPNRF